MTKTRRMKQTRDNSLAQQGHASRHVSESDRGTERLKIQQILGNRTMLQLAREGSAAKQELSDYRWSLNFNRRRISRRDSILFVQHLVGMPSPNGVLDLPTTEYIARYQRKHEMPEQEGQLSHFTMAAFFRLAIDRASHDAFIRLVMDYYDMKDYAALKSIRFNPKLGRYGLTTPADEPGMSDVEIGEEAFDYSSYFEFLVHTIAHELEHVRQNKEGIEGTGVGEFLSESINVLSKGLPAKRFPDFMDDARRAFDDGWSLMEPEDRKRYRRVYREMQSKVKERFDAELELFVGHDNFERFVWTFDRYKSPPP